ncbi:NAD(+) hydrolase SARM1-like isoform X4 [Choloepus didactylus]|uniref:NAD(+) hydrolase SARM1-like isoform X4 n=1 Tax=Choloepus didactylus TaxID=27675 RepID=UPI0018A1079E|nr:NAD(+) hydrolase SARM1-like isoform X4 [Choloepus didactylus]
MVLTLLLSAYKLCRVFTMSGPRPGAERLAVPGPEGGGGAGPWWAAGCRGPREVSPGVGAEVQGALERALPELAEVFQLVEEAWLLPAVGREVAQGLCEAIRLDGGLDLLPRLLQASELETRVQAARLLEQILVAENRACNLAFISTVLLKRLFEGDHQVTSIGGVSCSHPGVSSASSLVNHHLTETLPSLGSMPPLPPHPTSVTTPTSGPPELHC